MGITQQIGASSLIKPGVIDNTAARPASPYEGQVIFQKDTDQLLVWNGTAWVIPNSPAQNPTGLELVKTQTIGSGVGSVTVSGAFSSNYDNYLVTMNGGSNSTAAVIGMYLGSTTTGYYSQYIYTTWNNTVASDTSAGLADRFIYSGGTTTNGHNMSLTVMSPNLPNSTRVHGWGGEGTAYVGHFNGWLNNTNQYTDFTVYPTAGSMTGGSVRVYGYRKI